MEKIGRRCNKLYQRLGISRDASQREIKKAYLDKAKIFHPDVGGEKETFQEILEAFQVLSNPCKRRNYDQTGSYDSTTVSEQTIIEQAANSIIAGHFNHFCNEHKDKIVFLDVIELIRQKLSEEIAEYEKKIKDLNAGMKTVEAILKRLEYSGNGINILEGVCLKYLEGNQDTIDDLKTRTKHANAALKMLKNYQFNFASRQSNYIKMTVTTSTTGW